MRRFEVESVEVLAAIQDPDHVTESIKGRKNAWKKRAGDWLRVTYFQEDNGKTVVVTVSIKRKFFKEGDYENRV